MYGKDGMYHEVFKSPWMDDHRFMHENLMERAQRESQKNNAVGIGDITSDKRGTGARYNTGKMRVDLIPFFVIAEYEDRQFEVDPTPELGEALDILKSLSAWQTRRCEASDILAHMDDPWPGAAAVFEWGEKKYTSWNWAKGMPWSVPAACAVRHLLAILRGEQNDPESGLPHIGHVASNLVMLVHFEGCYLEGDDRPDIFGTDERGRLV